MLLAKLHKRALLRMQTLSIVRKQLSMSNNKSDNLPLSFLEAPSTSPRWNSPDSSLASSPAGKTTRASTRIVCMSDTHGKHNDIPFLPPGDVLIHAGDFTKMGETQAVQDLSRYFQHQQESGGFSKVICIAGNHDITFHPDYYEKTWSRHIRSFDPMETRQALQHCIYLEDSSVQIRVDDDSGAPPISVYGSPWTPSFFRWAFNLKRGDELGQVWGRIPTDTDILVTHGPPHGRGDVTLHSGHSGCRDLLDEIQHRVQPRLHIFGHIHEGYGVSYDGRTLYVNASNLDIGYEAINPCIVIDLPHDRTQPAMVVQPQRHHPWIHDMDDFLFWLKQSDYRILADIMAAAKPQGVVSSLFFSTENQSTNNNNSLYSGLTYQSLCDQLSLKRRKHRPAKLELRTALCQLYAESFF